MRKSFVRKFGMLGLILAVMLSLVVSPAMADKLHLKDGRVLEGRVEREGDGFVYFLIAIGGIEHRQLFRMDEVKEIERDEAVKQAAATPKPGEQTEETLVIPDGATRIAFITLQDTVGPYLNADALLESKRILDNLPEAQRPDIVVLVINSGGGALLEVEPLSNAIHKELKKDYRVVGWIESAISAASLTVFNCEEIYMKRQGNVGGTVAYSMQGGSAKAMEGEGLAMVLDLGAEISRRGRYNPLIMKAMQVFMTLSCDIDAAGNVTWYEGDQGEHIVSAKDRILTFNSIDGLKYGISRGTVDTKDELARMLGCHEWVEVGKKADEYQVAFRENVRIAEARAGELYQRFSIAYDAAGRARTEQDLNREVGKARQIIRELRSIARRAPSVQKYGAGPLPPLDDDFFNWAEDELRKLQRDKKFR